MSENEDDLYIFGQPPDAVPTIAEAFLENPLVMVASIDHPLAGQNAIPLERLVEQPKLAREPGPSTHMTAERLLAEHGLKMKVRMELGSNETLKHAVIDGLGIAALSRHTLPFEFPGGRLSQGVGNPTAGEVDWARRYRRQSMQARACAPGRGGAVASAPSSR